MTTIADPYPDAHVVILPDIIAIDEISVAQNASTPLRTAYRGKLKRLRVLWCLGWLGPLALLLMFIDPAAALVSHWLIAQHPALFLTLSLNSYVVFAAAALLPMPAFLAIIIPRELIGYPVSYLVGKRGKHVLVEKHKATRLVTRVESWQEWQILALAGMFGVVPWIPFVPNPIDHVVGARGIKFRKMTCVMVPIKIAWAFARYEIGEQVNPYSWVLNAGLELARFELSEQGKLFSLMLGSVKGLVGS